MLGSQSGFKFLILQTSLALFIVVFMFYVFVNIYLYCSHSSDLTKLTMQKQTTLSCTISFNLMNKPLVVMLFKKKWASVLLPTLSIHGFLHYHWFDGYSWHCNSWGIHTQVVHHVIIFNNQRINAIIDKIILTYLQQICMT